MPAESNHMGQISFLYRFIVEFKTLKCPGKDAPVHRISL